MNLRESIKKVLLENNSMRHTIREMVRDIIIVFKENDNGEFTLPEYFEDRDEMVYNIKKFGSNLTIDLSIEENESVDDFVVNANYVNEEETIEINISYNPTNKNGILYDLIGELNELIAHELRHFYQEIKKTYDIGGQTTSDPYTYYSQPHEIDAQHYGFKRLSKLTKKPFEDVVRKWFDTHKDLHRLSDQESDKIINKILNHK
jgi:hypothetical protein